MKLFSVLFLVACLLFGCTSPESLQRHRDLTAWLHPNGKIKVLCTTRMILDLVKEIGGDNVDGIALIMGGIDPHSYQLVKGDDDKFSHADLIFYNGLGLEHRPGLQYGLVNRENSVAIGDLIIQSEPSLLIRIFDEPDPHIWMDISIWAKAIPVIAERLIRFRPDQENAFRENSRKLLQKMLNYDQRIRSEMLTVPEEFRYLVTTHDAFNYFARAYLASESERVTNQWKSRVAAPEGLAPESQLSPCLIRMIVDYLKKNHVHVIFSEEGVNVDSLIKIISVAREEGLIVSMSQQSLYSDSLKPADDDENSYLTTMLYNTEVIINSILPEKKSVSK